METPDFNNITPEWIKEQLQIHGVKASQLAEDICQNKSYVSGIVNGHREQSNLFKAAVYYYFQYIKLEKVKEAMRVLNNV